MTPVPDLVFLLIVGYLVAVFVIGLSLGGWLWRGHRRTRGPIE